MNRQTTEANTKITWKITGFRNPITPRDVYNVFTVYTSAADVNLKVDENPVGISVSDPALLLSASFVVSQTQSTNQGIVQEVNTMELRFSSPVPLRPNCLVEYWLPVTYYDAEEVTRITTGGLFAGRKSSYSKGTEATTKTFSVTSKENGAYKALSFRSCEDFRSQGPSESTRIEGLTQPKSTQRTSSLKIFILEGEGEGQVVATLDQGVTFKPLLGAIKFNTASMTPTTVLISTAITLSFSPNHGLPASMSPLIKISFPEDYVVQKECNVGPQ